MTNNSEPPEDKKRKRAKVLSRSVPLQRKIFAANFKRARRKAGLTQRDVHRETGLAQSYICRVEKCLSNISLDNMAKLADLVGKPLHLLLTPKRTKKPNKK